MNSCLLNGECTSNIPYVHFVLNEFIEPASIWINKHTIELIYYLFWLMVFLMVFWLVEQERAAQAWWRKMSGHITEKKYNRDEFSEPWEYRYQNIPLAFFGGGAVNAFEHYLTRESSVSVTSIDDIVNWLVGCDYVSDQEQFGKRDHWQHPVDFEQTRRGDCEDFALWAWRKLVELGYDAEFMVGKWIRDERAGTHAWVFLEYDGEQYVFESTGRSPERVLKSYEIAADHYLPFAAVDRELRKKVYNGLLHWLRKLT